MFMGMNARGMITDPVLLRQAVCVLGAVLLAFIFSGLLRLEAATIALTGAAVLMLLDNWQHHDAKQSDNVHNAFAEVDWITIFFFIGLFVVVHAVERSGLLDQLARRLVASTGNNLAAAGAVILWVSAGLSAHGCQEALIWQRVRKRRLALSTNDATGHGGFFASRWRSA
jgi:Na+/H+ antiporter NhaD/arsenite permease-like protein